MSQFNNNYLLKDISLSNPNNSICIFEKQFIFQYKWTAGHTSQISLVPFNKGCPEQINSKGL